MDAHPIPRTPKGLKLLDLLEESDVGACITSMTCIADFTFCRDQLLMHPATDQEMLCCSAEREIQELLEFRCVRPLRTVHSLLQVHQAFARA